jgi:hypothetical protein
MRTVYRYATSHQDATSRRPLSLLSREGNFSLALELVAKKLQLHEESHLLLPPE